MRRLYSMLPLIVVIFNSGCATHFLWTESHTSSFCEPAQNAHLKIFEAPKDHDLLAVYDEVNEHNDAIRRRAYLIMANARRVSASHRPVFVNPNAALNLRPISLRVSTNSGATFVPERLVGGQETGWTAASTANQHRFSLFSSRQHCGTYDLPVYEDGSGFLRRTLFTPLAVALDITVIGGVLYLQAGAPGLGCY